MNKHLILTILFFAQVLLCRGQVEICSTVAWPDSGNPIYNEYGNHSIVAAGSSTNLLWQNGSTLRIKFLNGDCNLKKKVIEYASIWTNHVNLKFHFIENGDSDIRISFNKETIHNSFVGKDALKINQSEATMNLGLDGNTNADTFRRVVLHEFGHALGFYHEHQSPINTIPWNKNRVYEAYAKIKWDKEKVDNHVLNATKKEQTQYSIFDTKSIMIYPIPKSLTDGIFEVPYNTNLSNMDISYSRGIYPGRVTLEKPIVSIACSSTLFLFDLSGSMNENGANSNISKLQQAKNASKATLNAIKNNRSGELPEVAVLGFSGDCAPDPTTMISNFETNLSLVESRIDAMGAGGGTPLAEAIAASECKLANYLSQTGQNNGKLIVLSDGQATCQPIRPPGTYNSGQFGQTVITVNANQCSSNNYKIKYYTIGLNIAAGSPAERDLQYLSQISGGKYLNVQSQTQLERAFRKFNRIYVPKPSPYSNGLPTMSISKFDEGVSQINTESFSSALKNCEEFAKLHPDDCHGAYNLALMQEANDFYKNAITNYQKYLSLCPSAPDKEFVEKQIAFLEEEFRQFLLFQKEVVKSDLEYLKIHFDKIQNGQSVALAEEFKGFLKEKGDYYKNLSELTGKNSDRIFKKNCQEVALGLDTCAKTINRNPSTWDRDATPSLSMTYLNLERLLEGF